MPEVDDTEENFEICMEYCGNCPSYPGEKGKEGLYCARGPSEKEVERKGCDCAQCPLTLQYGLKDRYYCDGGE